MLDDCPFVVKSLSVLVLTISERRMVSGLLSVSSYPEPSRVQADLKPGSLSSLPPTRRRLDPASTMS
jgi:hypothetical protein